MNDIDSTIQDHRNNGRRILGRFHLYPPVDLIHSIGFAPVCPLAAERHLPSRTSQRPRPADLGLVGGKVCDVRDLYLFKGSQVPGSTFKVKDCGGIQSRTSSNFRFKAVLT